MKAKRNAVIYLVVICTLLIATLIFAAVREHRRDVIIRCYQGINAIQDEEIVNRDATIITLRQLVQLKETQTGLLKVEQQKLLEQIDDLRTSIKDITTEYNGLSESYEARLLKLERVSHTREMELLAEIKRLEQQLELCNPDPPVSIEPAPPIPGCK